MSKLNLNIKRPDDFVPLPDQILEETLIPQFERIVYQYPDRMAIKSSAHQLNYQELNNAINNLAYKIGQVMGKEKSPIAFMFNDEVYSIIALFAIMKAGRPYVGIHPGNPPDLVNGILNDSTAKLLITNSSVIKNLGKTVNIPTTVYILNTEIIESEYKHQNLGYLGAPTDHLGIFYTSGSTGMPKGILCNHLSRIRSIHSMINEWYFSPSDHISLLHSVCYLASSPSLFGTLLTGALLCVFDLKTNSAQKALNWIVEEELTVFRSTPTILRALFSLLPEDIVFSNLRLMTLGGETVTDTDIELFKSHTAEDCVMINIYGGTEPGSICNYHVGHDTLVAEGILPAGFPAPDKDVFLVDEKGDEVKSAEEGEIAVRSQYLNLGYWGQPELTAQKFREDPHDSNLRICFTGDRGYWDEGGALVVLGRKDTQVKVRGFRIQLEAIDHELLSIDGIKNAVTIVHKAPRRGDRLVSYFVASDQEAVSISQLRINLSAQLPSYMIPSVFVQMDSLPMTATGKITRSKLPLPTRQRPDLAPPLVVPRNEIETAMVNIWQDVLELDQVGVN
ncbi:MAG: AMP-binding protein, partial [Candidatus Heimdallarchaeota archaeon]|nr:AMP-binding protein [Candidatus Heimdallarchaeota archaeon]